MARTIPQREVSDLVLEKVDDQSADPMSFSLSISHGATAISGNSSRALLPACIDSVEDLDRFPPSRTWGQAEFLLEACEVDAEEF